jgi:tripartite-type tricarboxylate transporter receptor subunit TctC
MPTPNRPNLSRRAAARRLIALGLASGLATLVSPAAAQTWPVKPVRIVVPYPAGGSTDLLARMLAKKLAEGTGQAFVVDNRAGANGNLGAAAVASAAPDGYTLLFTTTGPLVFNKFIYKATPFDPAKDFTPIVKAADIPLLVAAHPSVPAKSLAELVAYARDNPGKLNYSTAGNGSMGHLTAELLQRRAGIRMTHVPYKGSAPALNDLIAGVVNVSFDLAPTYAQYVKDGRVRALAVTTRTRSPLMPDTATLAEQGVRDFEATGWNAFVGPAGLPAEVVQSVNAIVNRFIASDEGKEALRALGMQPAGGTPQQLAAFMAAETKTWQPIASSVKVE